MGDQSSDMPVSCERLIRCRICHSLGNDWSETDMPKSCDWLIRIRSILANDWSESGYAQILQTIDKSLDMPKSCKRLIRVWIFQCLANDWLESGYAKVLKMIEQLESGLCRIWKPWKYLEASWTKVWLEQRLCLEFQFESSSVMFAFSNCSVRRNKMIGDNKE